MLKLFDTKIFSLDSEQWLSRAIPTNRRTLFSTLHILPNISIAGSLFKILITCGNYVFVLL